MTVYNMVLWLILVYKSRSFAPLMNLYLLDFCADEMRGNPVLKGNHARLTRSTASWSVMVDVYNYCSAESAKVTVEPVQDKLDKLPHTPIPVLHQGTTEQSHNNQSFVVAKQPACESRHSILHVLFLCWHSSFLLVSVFGWLVLHGLEH